MTKPSFRPIALLDVSDRALEQVNDTLAVPTMVRASVQPAASAVTLPRPSAEAPREKLTVVLPGYLMDAMKLEALNRRVTLRHLVMLAMQSIGLTIDPRDLVPDARKTSGRSAG